MLHIPCGLEIAQRGENRYRYIDIYNSFYCALRSIRRVAPRMRNRFSHDMSWHAWPCHDMTCHDHVMTWHAMSCHVMAMSCHDMSWPCHDMTCHDMTCHVMHGHVMSWHVMTCMAMSCHGHASGHVMHGGLRPCHAWWPLRLFQWWTNANRILFWEFQRFALFLSIIGSKLRQCLFKNWVLLVGVSPHGNL